MRTWSVRRSVVYAMALVALSGLVLPTASHAATAQAIDASVDQTLTQFKQQHEGADAALNQAKGVLVFPQIVQAGVGLSGSYGEGALRIGGQTTGYYSIGTGSVGITVGAQSKAVIILFMQDAPLQEFQRDATTDNSWQVGLNGDVTVVDVGASGPIVSSALVNRPIVSFTMDQKGLMVNLSIQGSKVTNIER
jgi:lipid-binding SYLF domain-containing protein